MSTIGEKIKVRREELKLSQEQLAVMAGCSRRTIVSCETTSKQPYDSTIRKIAAALGLTVRYLKHDEIDDPQAGSDQEPLIEEAREMYGKKGAAEMAVALSIDEQIFSSGTYSEDQKDMFFEAISKAYFMNKQRARDKKRSKGQFS